MSEDKPNVIKCEMSKEKNADGNPVFKIEAIPDNANMTLWDAASKTDRAFMKKVDQKGGFIAIDAQYQIWKATQAWGPYGGNWGVKGCQYDMVTFDPVSSGAVRKDYISLDATFYYPGGSFEIGTDMVFKAADDCRKKLLTDLTTKALSKLGFSADVFLGLHDGGSGAASKREIVEESGLPQIESKPVENPGDYVIALGEFVGKKISDVPKKALQDHCKAKKKEYGENLPQKFQDLMDNAAKFYKKPKGKK